MLDPKPTGIQTEVFISFMLLFNTFANIHSVTAWLLAYVIKTVLQLDAKQYLWTAGAQHRLSDWKKRFSRSLLRYFGRVKMVAWVLSWYCRSGTICPARLILKLPESINLLPNKPVLIFLAWTYNNLGIQVVRAKACSIWKSFFLQPFKQMNSYTDEAGCSEFFSPCFHVY